MSSDSDNDDDNDMMTTTTTTMIMNSQQLLYKGAWTDQRLVQGKPAFAGERPMGKLTLNLRGHYGYYGITGNSLWLGKYRNEVGKLWRKWLGRRSQKARMGWPAFNRLLKRYPLPAPRVVHSIYRTVANL